MSRSGRPSGVLLPREDLQRQLAEFSLTIDSAEPDSTSADLLNRAIWHSVKGFETPYNYGRSIVARHASFESLLRWAQK